MCFFEKRIAVAVESLSGLMNWAERYMAAREGNSLKIEWKREFLV